MQRYSFIVDGQLRIKSWDETLGTLGAKSQSDVLGIPYFEVIPKICDGDADAVLQVLKEGKSLHLKGYRVQCLLGGIEADVLIEPIIDEAGIVRGAGVSMENIQGCALEKKLQQLQPIIDIGKIASTLAHGVRNPLNAIKGAVVYIKDKYPREKTLVEFTGIIEEEIARLDQFVTKFLSTSVFDNELSDTDINAMIKKLEVFTSLQAQSCNVEVVCNYGKVPALMLNSFHVEQAILNLINNAIEAMPAGGRLLVETKTERCSEQDFVVIQIADTGTGMVNCKENVFHIPSQEKIKERGKGFGMFITREVIQSHGGHLEIKSEKGFGTTIKMFFPISKGSGGLGGFNQ